MEQDDRSDAVESSDDGTAGDRQYTKPKLTYIAPRFKELGDLKRFTAGFFGSFSAS